MTYSHDLITTEPQWISLSRLITFAIRNMMGVSTVWISYSIIKNFSVRGDLSSKLVLSGNLSDSAVLMNTVSQEVS